MFSCCMLSISHCVGFGALVDLLVTWGAAAGSVTAAGPLEFGISP
jgi:hypothetical protein